MNFAARICWICLSSELQWILVCHSNAIEVLNNSFQARATMSAYMHCPPTGQLPNGWASILRVPNIFDHRSTILNNMSCVPNIIDQFQLVDHMSTILHGWSTISSPPREILFRIVDLWSIILGTHKILDHPFGICGQLYW